MSDCIFKTTQLKFTVLYFVLVVDIDRGGGIEPSSPDRNEGSSIVQIYEKSADKKSLGISRSKSSMRSSFRALADAIYL